MEKPRVPASVKKALAIGAAVAVPLVIAHEGEKAELGSRAPEMAHEALAVSTERQIVPDGELDKQIAFTTKDDVLKTGDTDIARARAAEALASVDSVRTDIAKTLDTDKEKDTEKPATKLEAVKEIKSIAEYESDFRAMITDTLKKKNKGTALEHLSLTKEGDHLAFTAAMSALGGVVAIKVSGDIVQKENVLAVVNSKIHATWGFETKVKKSIGPLLPELCSDLNNSYSNTYGKKVKSVHLSGDQIVIEFEEAKEGK